MQVWPTVQSSGSTNSMATDGATGARQRAAVRTRRNSVLPISSTRASASVRGHFGPFSGLDRGRRFRLRAVGLLDLEHVVARRNRDLPALAIGIGDRLLLAVDVFLVRKELEEVARRGGDGENSGIEDNDHIDRWARL